MAILELIRASPIVDIAKDDLLTAYFGGGALYELKTRDPRYSFGVHLTTVRNLYLTEYRIKQDKRDYSRKFFSYIFGKDWIKPIPYK